MKGTWDFICQANALAAHHRSLILEDTHMKIFDFEKDGTAYRMKLNIRTYSNGNLALAMHIHTDDDW